MTELINLTPHPIRIYTQEVPSKLTDIDEGLVTIIPPSGQVARLAAEEPRGISYTGAAVRYENAEFGSAHIQLDRVVFTTVYGLPAPREDVFYIVPLVTAIAVQAEAPARTDLLVPYEQVRNAEGTVVGCRTLAQPC
jgi:hypothetical protein